MATLKKFRKKPIGSLVPLLGPAGKIIMEVIKMKEEVKDFCYCVKDGRVAVLIFPLDGGWKYVSPKYFEKNCLVIQQQKRGK